MSNNGSVVDVDDSIARHAVNYNGFTVEGFSVDESMISAACKKLKSNSGSSQGISVHDWSREASDREIASERQHARNRSYSPSSLRNQQQYAFRVGSERPPQNLHGHEARSGGALHKKLLSEYGDQLLTNSSKSFSSHPAHSKGALETAGGIREKLSELRRHVSHLADRCTTLEEASSLCSQVKLAEDHVLEEKHTRMMDVLASLQKSSTDDVLASSGVDMPQGTYSDDALKSYITSLTAGTVSTASTPLLSRDPSPSPVRCDTGRHSSPLSTSLSSTIGSAYAMRGSAPSELRYHRHPEIPSPTQQPPEQSLQQVIELDPPSWFKPPPGSLEFSLAPLPAASSTAPISPGAVDFNFHRSTSNPAMTMANWNPQGSYYAGHGGATYSSNSFADSDVHNIGSHASKFCRASSHGTTNSTRHESAWQWSQGLRATRQSNSYVPMQPNLAAMQRTATVAPYVPGQMFEQSVR